MPKTAPPPLSHKVPFGIEGLDEISRGGLHPGGVYLVLGRPGAGKTTLANQVCFNHAKAGGKALFVTLLTESHARMVRHLSAFDFFDAKQVGTSIRYVSGYDVLEKEKLPGLLALLRKIIRAEKATLLVVDGLVTAGDVGNSDLQVKKFIHELQALIELVGCTALLLTGGTASVEQYAVRTMVEGLIELNFDPVGMAITRTVEAVKWRGNAVLQGRHQFDITDRGIAVYPRIESILGGPQAKLPADRKRISVGIKSLDDMLGGGISPASVTLTLGSAGSGKTVLGLSFLAAGARLKEPGLYVGFSERPERLIQNATGFGGDLSTLLAGKHIEFLTASAGAEVLPDALVAQIIARVKRRGTRRLFIDGIEGLQHALLAADRSAKFFAALCDELRALGVTAVLSAETQDLFGPVVELPMSGLSLALDNIIFLRHVELRARLHRLISVMKMRGGGTDPSLREFSIGARGIVISPTFDSAEAILTGIARVRPDVSSRLAPGPGKSTRRRRS